MGPRKFSTCLSLYCTLFFDFLIQFLFVRHTVSPPLGIVYTFNISFQPIFPENWFVLVWFWLPTQPNSRQLNSFPFQPQKCDSCWSLSSLFQPQQMWFVLICSFNVPTADVRYMLVSLQSVLRRFLLVDLVLAVWINSLSWHTYNTSLPFYISSHTWLYLFLTIQYFVLYRKNNIFLRIAGIKTNRYHIDNNRYITKYDIF